MLTRLLVCTLGIIFFAIFFRESPRIVKVCCCTPSAPMFNSLRGNNT